MSKKFFIILIMLLSLTSCIPQMQQTDQGFSIEQKIDPNLYELTLEINKDIGSYSQTQGSMAGVMFNGYGSVSGSIWTDGKGLVRGEILSISPSVTFAKKGDEIIVKTTDFKIAALQPGDTVYLICTTDYEPICTKNENGYGIAECIDIWEFDFCRMIDFESPK